MKRLPHLALALVAALVAALGSVPAAEIAPRYDYNLADFTGPVPFMGVRVRLDAAREEAFILSQGYLRIFGPTGMETYSVPLDPSQGEIYDVAVDETGDLYLLGYEPVRRPDGGDFFLLRCDYRGVPQEKLLPMGIPEAMKGFSPSTLIYAGGKFYLSASSRLQVLVLNKRAGLEQVRDFTDSLPEEKDIRKNANFGGLAVDAQGNVVVSVPIDFGVYVMTPDGTTRRFGEAGSRPGYFNQAGPVATDAAGNIYVADLLRSTVMVFDSSFQLVTEFGGYGTAEGQMIRPADLAISAAGRLFVSQFRNRGVAVFTLSPPAERS
jgi:DNA-binding beta-propeller fold protein YncE